MPLYEYRCDNCGRTFEVIQKFSDPLAEHCPRCGKGPVHKLMSSPAIQFKGTGWYVTDYPKKDSTTANRAERNTLDKQQSDKQQSEKQSGNQQSDKQQSGKKSESSEKTSTPSSDSSSKKD